MGKISYSNLLFADNNQLRLGTGSDLRIYHNGSNSFIQDSGTGDLRLMSSHLKLMDASENLVLGVQAGAVAVTGTLTVGADGAGHDVKFFLNASGRYIMVDEDDNSLIFTDNASAKFGNGGDLQLMHDGTDSRIDNMVGHLKIRNYSDDSDIIFETDNGSGSTTEYLRFDGSSVQTIVTKNFRYLDNAQAMFGTSEDLAIYHDATNSYVNNATGDLYIKNTADDKDLIFQCDDGSGGVETYFYLDGSLSSGNPVTIFPDNSSLYFGSGTDLKFTHNGTDSYIQNYTGDLRIENDTTNGDIIFRSDDGSGGLSTYFRVDGGLEKTIFPDNQTLGIGSGGDFNLKHDGSNTLIENTTGHVYFYQKADDSDIIFLCDDGSGGNTTYFQLDGSHTETVFSEAARFADDKTMSFGASSDLQLHHNGSNSYISQNGTGDLYIMNTTDDEDIIFVCDDGAGGNGEYFRLDGSQATHDGSATTGLITIWPDNSKVVVGGGTDGRFWHDGTNTYLQNITGNLIIQNFADDKDIALKSDDGAGGTTEYLTIDGSATSINFMKSTYRPDNVYSYYGNNYDLRIHHDGTDTFFHNDTGDLTFQQDANDKDIIFQADDGSGGLTAYLTLDGSAETVNFYKNIDVSSQATDILFGDNLGAALEFKEGSNLYMRFVTTNSSEAIQMEKATTISNSLQVNSFDVNGATQLDGTLTVGVDDTGYDVKFFGATSGAYMLWDESDDQLEFSDNAKISLGASDDLQLYHSGSASAIRTQGTGDFYIQQTIDDKDIIFQSDDGSGGVTTYFSLDGSLATHNGSFTTATYTIWGDRSHIAIGGAKDMQLYHDGSNSYIQQIDGATGDLIIEQGVDDGDMIFKSDDGSGGTSEYFRLDGGVTRTIFSAPITVGQDDTGYDVVFFGATSGRYMMWDESSDRLELTDNTKIKFGDGADGEIYHSGSNLFIGNTTGNINIINSTDNGDISFQADDGSGGNIEYFRLDGGDADGTLTYTKWADNSIVALGASKDLRVYHNGTNSIIQNYTGNLSIRNGADDGDIIFDCDDGSGGLVEYFRLDGSSATGNNEYTVWPDDSVIALGASKDMQLYHDGSKSWIYNNLGNLEIRNTTADADIIFSNDDGSGGETAYITLDGTNVRTKFHKTVNLEDDVQLQIGNSQDLKLYHNGSHSFIDSIGVGDLYISQSVDDGDIIFMCDDGSGGTEEYFRLDGSVSSGNPYTVFPDNSLLAFGTGRDFIINHNGTNTNLGNYTGDLEIVNYANDKDVIFKSDDGSGGTETYFYLDGSEGLNRFSKNVLHQDNVKGMYGTGLDLQIYHSGTQSYIDQTGTGNLYIRTKNNSSIYLQDTNGQAMAQFTDGGGSFLYFSNSLKLSTTSAGITVSGSLILEDDGTIGSASDTDAISIDDSGVVTFSSRIKANVREFEVASGTDGDAKGDVVYFGSTTSMTAGAIYHYKSDGTWELVDADSAATCDGLLAVALGAASNTNGMLLRGMVTIANDPGAVGDVLYASTTAGQATATAPSGSGDIVRVIGYCVHATNGNIWFNPDGTFVEVA